MDKEAKDLLNKIEETPEDDDDNESQLKKNIDHDDDISETSDFNSINGGLISDDESEIIDLNDEEVYADDDDGDSITVASSIITDKKKKVPEKNNDSIYKDYSLQDWIKIKPNDYYKKLSNIRGDYVKENHPEILTISNEEIQNECNNPNKKTLPFITKYEKARVIGLRATQISNSCEPFVDIPEELKTNEIAIAELELEQNKIPFIIKRTFANGISEYWRVCDLMII